MKKVVFSLMVVILAMVFCSPVIAQSRSILDEQIDWVISEINAGNNAMHMLAREYLSDADGMGGFDQGKLNRLRDYLRNVRPANSVPDRFSRPR